MYKFNKDYIFRVEYFGGILINRHNFQILELDYNEAVWLTALEYSKGNVTCAKRVTQELGYNPEIEVCKFINKKVLSGIYDKIVQDELEDIVFKTKEKCLTVFK